ncbi:inositol monophosphatase family protein [Engelhardtia mirabilis]|uniref:Inositol monophosphatase family protein n=1 Tax=Engelhardtia mirabilis TaxID=2528011 RepID=A0A518BIP4_9BACT|nr:Inositol monophosphatase family protein [Planctomycetes bacterium Pla133]QDV01168.1 Inositol monophosphatase family protein [Planctomycetes bacterium Pla86]
MSDSTHAPPAFRDTWEPRLRALCEELRATVRTSLTGALEAGSLDALGRAEGIGAGDFAFGLDVPTERLLDGWLERVAARAPLSLMTEDSGWRHRGPDGSGGVRELPDFDHGGPRIAIDPIDGTRNLMHDLRSAWTLVSYCDAGAGPPRLGDVCAGIVAELPDSRGGRFRVVSAARGQGCRIEEREVADGRLLGERRLTADDDDRADHGYFPFFRYAPDLRAPIAALESAFLQRLETQEQALVEHCFDDQYICSAGQLVLTMLGRYRMVVDARPLVAARLGRSTRPSKPYDLAGAVLCAREAGCVVEAPDGSELDFELDTLTPVAFAAFHNPATARRLAPHLRAVLGV